MFDASRGTDVGRNIPGGFDREPVGAAQMPWPDQFHIQGGHSGLVFRRSPAPDEDPSYVTAFVEVLTGETFLRGEGADITEAEAACWGKYQRWLHCPGPTGEHSWKPGYTAKSTGEWLAYHNGAGFCGHCGAFESKKFTAEELGQHCGACGVATMWHYERNADGQMEFACRKHALRTQWAPDEDDSCA